MYTIPDLDDSDDEFSTNKVPSLFKRSKIDEQPLEQQATIATNNDIIEEKKISSLNSTTIIENSTFNAYIPTADDDYSFPATATTSGGASNNNSHSEVPPIASTVPKKSSLSYAASLLVHSRQRGNPLLKYFRNVSWEYNDQILSDYQMSRTSCALYLSMRYHNLNPNYIYDRLKTKFPHDIKILLCQCDIKEPNHILKELARICLLSDFTLIVSWTDDESARYLETYKILENKSAEQLMERVENDYLTKLCDTLTTIKSVNKTDANTLLHAFGSLDSILNATQDQLNVCPGLGQLKAKRIYDAFHMPFLRQKRRLIVSQKLKEKNTQNEVVEIPDEDVYEQIEQIDVGDDSHDF
ncbi:unnamed protein product [Didymodactylos carnosus]|uniref:DNA excision repair protein ERCC-1 n=1 Tax=Didymodactylos carnosus TaxID=1234261 RepID=A0A813Y3W7_9BILA|nr:unnamed protein product [Didymodactylos carnosus]CAF0963110.1 unnamed protein product [Didymodactylos carnosus]CAF3662086.1 unnamed protein product [Didymodactylos carnosus]CAF3735695.1 unnamed protein product [Didymodactylos carnosus]